MVDDENDIQERCTVTSPTNKWATFLPMMVDDFHSHALLVSNVTLAPATSRKPIPSLLAVATPENVLERNANVDPPLTDVTAPK